MKWMVILSCLLFLVGFPLTVVGGIFGKNWTNGFDAPCRTKNIPREIPATAWYKKYFFVTLFYFVFKLPRSLLQKLKKIFLFCGREK